MSAESIIVQQPAGAASRLVLLLHGVGSVAPSMLGVARWFAARDPQAFVVSVAGQDASDISNGRQWFSVREVTTENRQGRVDAAMPRFEAMVREWQDRAGVSAQDTWLVGFSQGAIMALEATKRASPVAGHVVAMAGRYASLPNEAPSAVVHLLHGVADPVIPLADGVAAFDRLTQLGATVTLDRGPGIGHEPHPALLQALAPRLAA
jgi:phospholipase/carboxylesterase